ncbi:hypothetical protein ACFWBF_24545 [Streptomyces sp. NPDC060028]
MAAPAGVRLARPLWTYRLHTLNIAYGSAREDLFLGTPTRYVDERALLR